MKSFSQEEREWLEGFRTDGLVKPPSVHMMRYTYFDPSPQRNGFQWLKGSLWITSSLILFLLSFTPVWANPHHEVPPKDVLIPKNEFMKEDPISKSQETFESNPFGPQNIAPTDPKNETQKSVESPNINQQQPSESVKQNPSQTSPTEDLQAKNQQTQNTTVSPSQEKQSDQPTKPKTSHSSQGKIQKKTHIEPSKSSDSIKTENGGKLPNTATPFSSLFLRGLALVLLGLGLRALKW